MICCGKKFRELYADSNEPKDQIIKLLTWNYPQEHMVEHIMREVNGYDLSTGKLLNGIGEIKDDGTTNSGMWIYAGVMGEGVGRIFAASYKDVENGETRDSSSTPVDGPIPEFYEPVANALHTNHNAQFSPCVIYPRMPNLQKIGTKDEFPYVLCSSSIAENWCGGTITRHISWLNELVKEPFIEIPKKLAKKFGVKSGDEVIIRSARAQIREKAMVTNRIKSLYIRGEEVFVTWQPYNWGFKGLSTGPSGNYITIDALDPFCSTP